MDTINRLLRKQAPKRRGRIPVAEAEANAAEAEAEEAEKPQPTMVRWVSRRKGSRIGVPEEWLGTPAGRIFGEAPTRPSKLVEEV
jgi:Ino eighty subunit 2